jgi:hypothetical protein
VTDSRRPVNRVDGIAPSLRPGSEPA